MNKKNPLVFFDLLGKKDFLRTCRSVFHKQNIGNISMNLFRRFLFFILPGLFVLDILSYRTFGEESDNKQIPIRVCFTNTNSFSQISEKGVPSGYFYELLQHLAIYGDFNCSYTMVKNGWSEQRECLLNGKSDLIPGGIITAEYKKDFSFSDPITDFCGQLVVTLDKKEFYPNDYKKWNNIRVGLVQGVISSERFLEFAKQKGFTCIPVYYPNYSSGIESLRQEEKIDAMVIDSRFKDDSLVVLADFSSISLSFMVRKDDSELLNRLNDALKQLKIQEPQYLSNLYFKFYMAPLSEIVLFSPWEMDFIHKVREEKRFFTAVIDPDFKPFSWRDDLGTAQGYLREIGDMIFRRTGMSVLWEVPHSRAEYIRILKEHRIDLLMDNPFFGEYEAEQEGYVLTGPYWSSSVSMVTRSQFTDSVKRLAVLSKSPFTTQLQSRLGKEYSYIFFDTIEDVLGAVLSGKCDATYFYTPMAEKILSQQRHHLFKSVVIPDLTTDFVIAVKKTNNGPLPSIILKASKNLNQEIINNIVIEDMRQTKEVPFKYNTLHINLSIYIGLFLVFGLILFCFFRKQKRHLMNIIAQKHVINELYEQMKLTMMAINDGVLITDATGKIRFYNTECALLTGCKLEDYKNHPHTEVLRMENHFNNTIAESPIDQAIATKKIVFVGNHLELVNRDMLRHRILGAVSPVFDTQDNFLGTIFIFRDAYKVKNRMKEWDHDLIGKIVLPEHLQTSILGIVFDSIPCQVFIKDAENDFRYIVANKNFTDYYHLDPENVIDHVDSEIFALEVARQLRKNDLKVCSMPGEIFQLNEDVSFMNTGKEVFRSLKTCFITEDKHTYLLGVCVDITDIDRMQRELSKALTDAKVAVKAKSSFLASMSHEIRTPLNIVIGYAELLKDDHLPEKIRDEYLAGITSASNTLLELINDILDLSKLEAGKMIFTPEKTNFGQLVREIDATFLGKCNEIGLQQKLEIEEMPILLLDPLRLRQILFNLYGNAVKFTKQGSITIKASFVKNSTKKGTLLFSVIDTGVGISNEDAQQVFQPFVQASSNIDRKNIQKGTGLGLALIHRLVHQLNGNIELKSELGKGSSFMVSLPAITFTNELAQDKTKLPAVKFILRKYPELSVLIVDDVELNRKVLMAMIVKFAIKVETANSAEEALVKLHLDKYSIVLTDICMQQDSMSGTDLAEAIRHDSQFADIKVVAVTADVDTIGDIKEKLFDTILQKPITMEALNNIFEKSISKKE